MPNAQSELSLLCQALTHHIPRKNGEKEIPSPKQLDSVSKKTWQASAWFLCTFIHFKTMSSPTSVV